IRSLLPLSSLTEPDPVHVPTYLFNGLAAAGADNPMAAVIKTLPTSPHANNLILIPAPGSATGRNIKLLGRLARACGSHSFDSIMTIHAAVALMSEKYVLLEAHASRSASERATQPEMVAGRPTGVRRR